MVEGNSRWNGIHKVQSAGTDGILKTYTKVSTTLDLPNDSAGSDDWTLLNGDTTYNTHVMRNSSSNGSMWLSDFFSAGDFIYIAGANARNNGLYEVSSVANSTINAQADELYLGGRYIARNDDKENDAAFIVNKGDSLDNFLTETLNTDIVWYKVIYEPDTRITGDINVLNDESDTIDLPPYLSKALVYYVKGKFAEDGRDIEGKEYYMREFRKMVEKHQSSLVKTGRFISSGAHAIR